MVRKCLHSEEGTAWEQAEGNKILPLINWEKMCYNFATFHLASHRTINNPNAPCCTV